MQAISPLTVADLTSKVVSPRHKFEILVDGTWVNLCAMPTRWREVLTNGGFEAWASATDAAGWTETVEGGGESTVNREATAPYYGTYCCRFDIDAANSWARVDQDATLVPGDTYRLSFRYKTEAGKSVAAAAWTQIGGELYLLQAAGTWLRDSDPGFTSYRWTEGLTSETWALATIDFVADADIVAAATFRVESDDAASSSIYVDNISLLHRLPTNYLESLSVTPSGAGRLPSPAAGQWSATIANPGGIFHPFHPTSAYKDYFKVGREVRISTGLEVGGVTTWHQRLQGFMEGPEFGERSIQIRGGDYMALLARTRLTSGPTGNRFWGETETFDSVATGGTGSQLYNEADACDPDSEADNVTPWTAGASGGSVASVAGESSTFALEFTRDEVGPTEQGAQDTNIVTLVAGQQYIIQFKGAITAGENYARLIAYETIGGAAVKVAEATIPYNDGDESDGQVVFTAGTASALQLRVSTGGKYATATDKVRIDEISVKTYDPDDWYRYPLSPICTGVYAVTYDGEFVEHGEGRVLRDAEGKAVGNSGGWHYVPETNEMCFSEQMQITAGTANVKIYYFTAHSLDDLVADLLVEAGIYSTRALAIADMDYTPTGIVIDRPWFKAGASAREALEQICQRADYRFWFSGVNKPTFKPAAALKATPDFTFSTVAQIATSPPRQDLEAVYNHIAIEGEEQTVEPGTSEKPAKLTAEASDAALIASDGESTWSISNQLFQDATSIAAYATTYLAAYKTPKWYLSVPLPFSVIPFEPQDSITLQVQIAAGLSVEKKAIIQMVSFDLGGMNVRCEISEGYPVAPKYPDKGCYEYQGTYVPPAEALPDKGCYEYQGA